MVYLINCEYFNNLNENGDMAGTGIMAGICTSPYPYPYPVNTGIPRQNENGFEQYPRGRVYLPSLVISKACIIDFLNLSLIPMSLPV